MKKKSTNFKVIDSCPEPWILKRISALALICFLMTGIPLAGFSQADLPTIKGTVKSVDGDPVTGAVVVDVELNASVTTGPTGEFSIEAPAYSSLRIYAPGFLAQTVRIMNRTAIDIVLEPDVENLEEIVVVGYGRQSKVTMTSAVSKVDGDDISRMSVVNTSKSLQGLAPGITVIDRGGAPGGDDPTIYIRGVSTTGNSSPLVLVDGVELSLGQIPSHEIESISILKDASSTSIYGSRAANGVILVTTKRGRAGRAIVSYNGTIGIQDLAIRPKMVSAEEYMDMVNESSTNKGGPEIYTSDIREIILNGTDPYRYGYTNYVDEVFKKNYVTEHTLSITGGNEAVRYMTSINYLDQPGLTDNTKFQRYNFRGNFDMNVNRYFRTGVDVSYTRMDRLWPQMLGSAQYRAFSMVPTRPIRYADGRYTLDDQQTNPVAYTDLDVVGKDIYQVDRLVGQLKFELEPIKNLVLTGTAGINGNWARNKVHNKNYKFYGDDGETLIYELNASNGVVDTRNNVLDLTLRFLATYHKNWGDHKLDVLYGMEQLSSSTYYSRAERKNLISDEIPEVSIGSADSQFADGYPTKWGINSFFGRINYSFRDRYLFEANLRADGSSKFAAGNKWGIFPSFSAAWRISEEPFFAGARRVANSLKIRASWGQTGNERISPFLYLPQYTSESVVIDGALVTGVYPSGMANPDVTWETVELADVGVDFEFLDGKIFGELDYYRKETKDILLSLAIPNFIGLNAPEQNAGIVRNSGIEVMIGYRMRNDNFGFSTSMNFAYNKNQWVDRGSDDRNISGWTIQEIGSPLNAYYIYVADGLIANDAELDAYKAAYRSDPRGMSEVKAGDVKLVDVNGDGTIDANDRQTYHSNIPKATFGWNLTADYKGFDFSMLFQGSAGAKRFIYGEWYEGPSFEAFTGIHFRDRWTLENQDANASIPRLEAANNRNQSTYNSFFLKDISYVRLKNVQLGYTIPQRITEKIMMSKLRVYVSASNLFTISGLDQGLDPESVEGRPTSFPPLRIVNLGVNIVF